MFSPEGLANFCSGNAETGFRLVYNIELYLRHMVRWELVGERGNDWQTVLGDLKGAARSRQTQEAELRLIDTNPRNLLDYLLLTEIKDIMVMDAVWPLFKNRWPPQDMFLADFKLFNAIRHKVAHFRAPTDRDLRMLERFKDVLVEATAHYRQQKRGAKVIDPLSIDGIADSFQATLAAWSADSADPEGRWRLFDVCKVGKYLSINAEVRAGSFSQDGATRLVNESRCDAFFLSLDETRGLLRAYVPTSLQEEAASRLLPNLFSFPTVEDSPLDDEDLVIERFDFILPYRIELPTDFRA